MNKVDIVVKGLMHAMPVAFPNRWCVLQFLLLNPKNGLNWLETGEIGPFGEFPSQMSSFDLDEIDERLRRAEGYTSAGPALDFVKGQLVENGMRQMARRYTAEHIEYYARTVAPGDVRLEELKYLVLKECLIGNLPASIDPDWAQVCLDVAKQLKRAIAFHSSAQQEITFPPRDYDPSAYDGLAAQLDKVLRGEAMSA